MKITLTDYAPRDKKIQTIKGLRTITGWGLKESKVAIDNLTEGLSVGINIQEKDFHLLAEYGFSYLSGANIYEELISLVNTTIRIGRTDCAKSLIDVIDVYERK